ncbi:glycine zipper domain-containing protein [Hartmannibacter diazotrophicus]|nr:glycine zipper domain-containing protein [Hartmannibacter diazotrophicus]
MTNVKMSRVAIVVVAVAGLGLAGCQTSGKGATMGAVLGGGAGCAVGAAVSDNAGAGCLIGGLVGAFAGAIIGDAIERQQQQRVVYRAARSGGQASTGTFKNSKGQRVKYTAKPTKTYNKKSDSALLCRDIQYSKTVDGKAAGSGSTSECQVRVAGKPTWEAPEA